jgi:hypothetical protein
VGEGRGITMTGNEDNYIALMACILSNKSADAAIKSIFNSRDGSENMGRPLAPINQDTVSMAEMQKTMTYKQVGEQFGLSAGAVFVRIKRYKLRMLGVPSS